MKLWKVLARNGHHQHLPHPYTSCGIRPGTKDFMMELDELECGSSPSWSEDSGKHSEGSSIQDSCSTSETFLTTVRIKKKARDPLGIILCSGGVFGTPIGNSEIETCPSVASLRPGSVALSSDLLIPGDRIHSVNGVDTSRMRSEDVSALLDNVGEDAVFEIEYSLPNYASQNSLCLTAKVAEVNLERIDGSLGITLRGGTRPDEPHLSRPLVITHIRPDGPAHRSGLVRTGDRLLKIDDHLLTDRTLLEAQAILRERSHQSTLAVLTVEYDVSVMESVRYATGPLLVEIERERHDEDLGIVLSEPGEFGDKMYIREVMPASTADRCGALAVGDQLLAIDDVSLDDWNRHQQRGSFLDVRDVLKSATRLQVLPRHVVQRAQSRNYDFVEHFQSGFSPGPFGTLGSRFRNKQTRLTKRDSLSRSFESDSVSGLTQNSSTGRYSSANMGVCHSESLYITLTADRGKGYGLILAVSELANLDGNGNIVVTKVQPDSSAYRSGCIQSGDRILSVNHQSNLTLQEINSLLDLACASSTIPKIVLQVEFDVADTIVPSSGIFTIKLPKKGPSLGITITAAKNDTAEPFLISEIARGSIAHRTGTLHAGDHLLEIDNRPLDHSNVESAFDTFQSSSSDIVTLKIEKTESDNANLMLERIIYTVELIKYGGPLGITISGSENCSEPIVLSKLTEGGLAEKTGALHAGDRILAINGENLENRPLSDAIRLLQTSGDRVQIKIARNLNSAKSGVDTDLNVEIAGIMTDSAIASWDSNNPTENLVSESNSSDCTEVKDEESSATSDAAVSYRDGGVAHRVSSKSVDPDDPSQLLLQYYSDVEENSAGACPSPLPLPSYGAAGCRTYGHSKANFTDRLPDAFSNSSIRGEGGAHREIHHVTLYKDSIYDDYGFSLSDGLYEKGVYINRIRRGGPADIVGLLRPYDKILQVNETKTQDFDCCLTVPLIASAGDRIELIVARNPYLETFKGSHFAQWNAANVPESKSFFSSQNTITKTL